ncbi:hypothetical protein JOL79_06965 [Microbispora sp. RL4-1S]|uniref:Uncharacterized protein n=1 Tax=Microbispora oryzae TaxID=2806554 RepID=A0A940WMV7_9ACTN|nr:hypothetical protein [Microbispora oryzae]MBP2703539.1 hypothetical protein [Microbispora oryzae]
MVKRRQRALTDAELIRDLDDRLRRLENRQFVQIGVPPNAYVLQVDDAGQLVATSSGGTATVVALP